MIARLDVVVDFSSLRGTSSTFFYGLLYVIYDHIWINININRLQRKRAAKDLVDVQKGR